MGNMDEGTANLDLETEEKILEIISGLDCTPTINRSPLQDVGSGWKGLFGERRIGYGGCT